jgi:DnaJ family protein C protein 7
MGVEVPEAEAAKEKGNDEYRRGTYREALDLYGRAAELDPASGVHHSNSAACHLALGDSRAALEEARQATRLEPALARGWSRVARAALALGEEDLAAGAGARLAALGEEAGPVLEAAGRLGEARRSAEAALLVGRHQDSLHWAGKWLQEAPHCRAALLAQAESSLGLGQLREAGGQVAALLRDQPLDVDALHLKALMSYHQEQFSKASDVWRAVLRLDPDHEEARTGLRRGARLVAGKEAGNEAFKAGQFQAALEHYTQALALDPGHQTMQAKLLYNRATVYSKLGDLPACVADCTAALELQPDYMKALHRRAVCHDQLGDLEGAVRDWGSLCRQEPGSREYREGLRTAKLTLAERDRKDYYGILHIEKNASVDEVKKAYRAQAMLHHPDKHAAATEEEKREHEQKFKDIAEAFSVLSDTKLRWNYDNAEEEETDGFDLDEDGNIDSEAIWQSLFGGGQGTGYVVINDI